MGFYYDLLCKWERERREYPCLSPNLIWFQRHETKPKIIAQVTRFYNNLKNCDVYKWQVFDGEKNYECAEGNEATLIEAKKRVFEAFGYNT